eukprot:CAMPEP_0201555932 /NCGR_PEP_ID=MMETSP0173_2-20130828/52206_1 /ASSEMBLY_ACC=CAM_ASM_000268 /TAXON_ID=218659 /ORGANISM="Vexillifera sp., Strain DIVA3 564/2" /LENGTH=210 /DNA_ID=CAMNT_0047967955 /DNA_START=179 /DNA_END=807 /DNA_ORIENTATION=+
MSDDDDDDIHVESQQGEALLIDSTTQNTHDDDDDQGEAVMFWDYHVFILGKDKLSTLQEKKDRAKQALASQSDDTLEFNDECLVFDLDAHNVTFPCTGVEYGIHCLSLHMQLPVEFQHHFRLVDAQFFIEHFASDRRHMKDEKTGEWMATPPPYKCMKGPKANTTHNLHQFINMHDHQDFGQLMNRQQFWNFIDQQEDLGDQVGEKALTK